MMGPLFCIVSKLIGNHSKLEHFMNKVIHIIHCYVLLFFKYTFYLSLVSGLVCSALLKKLSKKAQNVKEHSLSTEFAVHARQELSIDTFYR